jgi:negative regulator of flagellin synthesis FlgM
MKIGHVESKPVAPAATAEAKPAKAATPGAAEPSAQVDISATASLLAGAGSDATFDGAKVERIAQAIRDGQFTINAEAIADKLIVNAAELLGRKNNG